METEQEHVGRSTVPLAGLAMALLVTLLMPGAALAERPSLPGVGTQDRRAPVDAGAAPWRSVVRVQTNLAGRCTGALVGPRTVLTAGHCLFNRRTRQFLQAGSLHVLFGYDRGAYSRHVRVERVTLDPGYDLTAPRPDESRDWALLTLAEPAPEGVPPLPLSAAVPVPGRAAMLGGYSQDRAQVLMADRDCQVLGQSGRPAGEGAAGGLLVHDCDATRGTSGGPLLVREEASPTGWAVAGVAVAAGGGAEVRNFAVPAARFAASLAKGGAAGQP